MTWKDCKRLVNFVWDSHKISDNINPSIIHVISHKGAETQELLHCCSLNALSCLLDTYKYGYHTYYWFRVLIFVYVFAVYCLIKTLLCSLPVSDKAVFPTSGLVSYFRLGCPEGGPLRPSFSDWLVRKVSIFWGLGHLAVSVATTT